MTPEKLYEPHIEKAANAYAYNKALDLGLRVIQCSGFEGGIRILATEMLRDGIVDPSRFLHWLESKSSKTPDKENWWVDDDAPKYHI